MALVSRLSPPYINGKLPAFYGNQLIIPYLQHPTVGFNNYDAMKLIIKTVSTNTQQAILVNGTNQGDIWYDAAAKIYKASFSFQSENSEEINYFNPDIGQYYKVQLAHVNNSPSDGERTGYYSSVGVIKYSAQPNVYIKDLLSEENEINKNIYEYVGVYLQESDLSEKIYSYRFDLYDEFDNIVASSGEKIHNNSADIDVDSSVNTWRLRKNLNPNTPYYLQYKVTTMNGLGEMMPCESPKYKIMELDIALPNIDANLEAKLNYEEAYIDIFLRGKSKEENPNLRSGSFILLRSSSKDNYDSWEQLTEFQLSLYDPRTIKNLYRDYTVEQGIDYIYAIQAYNSQGQMSGRLVINNGKIHCDFEDAFLFDGKRQLKIRFNPSISSFKSTILENKVDTIGSKYPFIFRNGIVNYKEFSISGLLSLLGDENKQFLFETDSFDNAKNKRINAPAAPNDATFVDPLYLLTGDNYYKEREFKLKVLEWLSDGKPKLFKSPAEGNYIVRLMNVTLTPEDILGRMLHSFDCTAYEIAEYNFEGLDKYNLIAGYTEDNLKRYTIDLNNINEHFIDVPHLNVIRVPQTYEATIIGDPNVNFSYKLYQDNKIYHASTGQKGMFEFPKEKLKNYPLIFIRLGHVTDATWGEENTQNLSWGNGALLQIGYLDPNIKSYSYIYEVTMSQNSGNFPQDFEDSDYDNLDEEEIVLPPFYDNEVEDNPEVPPSDNPEITPPSGENPEKPPIEKPKFWMKDILAFLEDLRKKTGMFDFIKISMRPIYRLEYSNGKLQGFWKTDGSDSFQQFEGDYSIFDINGLYTTFGGYIDGFDACKGILDNFHSGPINYKFSLNGKIEELDLESHSVKFFQNVPELFNFKIGNGIKVETNFQEKIISYAIENENEDVKAAKDAWLKNPTNNSYKKYIRELTAALNKATTQVGEDNVIYAI